MMRTLKHRFLFVPGLIALWLFPLLLNGAEALTDALLSDSERWSCSAADFLSHYPDRGFSFVDGGTVAKSNSQELSFLGFPSWETRVYFAAAGITRIEISLYNKGDAGELSQEAFKELIDKIGERLHELTGSRGITGKVSNDRPNYYVNRRSWRMNDIGVQVEWAFVNAHRSNRTLQPFRAEFVKVLLVPARAGSLSGQPSATPDWANRISGRLLLKNVEQNGAGDLWVTGVPMVDQGQKGYCAAAASERVLRYYGWQGDQHEIAQLADTAAQGGTSLEGMIKAVEVVGKRYQLTGKTLLDPGGDRSFEKSSFYKLIELYNRRAKGSSAEAVNYMDYCDIMPGNVKMVNIMRIFEAMDADVLKEAMLSRRQDYARFEQDITNYLKQGVPLFWACIVGKYPENPELGQSGAFGHIRLIIGINAREKELLYSDSWGPAHALKRMPLENAWAMTFGLSVIKPRDVR